MFSFRKTIVLFYVSFLVFKSRKCVKEYFYTNVYPKRKYNSCFSEITFWMQFMLFLLSIKNCCNNFGAFPEQHVRFKTRMPWVGGNHLKQIWSIAWYWLSWLTKTLWIYVAAQAVQWYNLVLIVVAFGNCCFLDVIYLLVCHNHYQIIICMQTLHACVAHKFCLVLLSFGK